MTAQLITEAIKKLEEARESLRMTDAEIDNKGLQWLVNSQKHYEIGKAVSQLEYVLSTL